MPVGSRWIEAVYSAEDMTTGEILPCFSIDNMARFAGQGAETSAVSSVVAMQFQFARGCDVASLTRFTSIPGNTVFQFARGCDGAGSWRGMLDR